jgi:hypothetical protein
MANKRLPIDKILTLLKTNPQTVAELTAVLTAEQLRTPPSEDEWSTTQVLAHLRSCADVWGGCIETILAEDRPTLRAINPTTWIKSTNYPNLEFQPSFHAFTTQRTELLLRLNSLAAEDWLRAATVTGAGKPLERTVQFYAQWLAKHERSHLKQFKHIVNVMSG